MVGLDPLVKLGRFVQFVCNVNVVNVLLLRLLHDKHYH